MCVRVCVTEYSGVSGPDPDRNISPTSLCGPEILGHTTTSECGRCLVLLHRQQFMLTKCDQVDTEHLANAHFA